MNFWHASHHVQVKLTIPLKIKLLPLKTFIKSFLVFRYVNCLLRVVPVVVYYKLLPEASTVSYRGLAPRLSPEKSDCRKICLSYMCNSIALLPCFDVLSGIP